MEEQRLGVDIGGTFTDIVFLAGDGSVRVRKIASTPHDFSEAVLEGSKLGMEEAGLTTDSISEVSHGLRWLLTLYLKARALEPPS